MDNAAALRLIPSKFNAALPPDWRWERARWLRENHKYSRRKEDLWVTAIKRFQSSHEKAQTFNDYEKLLARMPGLYYAYDAYVLNERLKWTIEAYLCAGTPLYAIAKRCCVDPETVAAYTMMFFDVTEKLESSSYMLNVAFKKSIHHGLHERDYDLLWKLMGYLGGTEMVDLCVQIDERSHVNSVDAAELKRHKSIRAFSEAKSLNALFTMPVAYNQEIILTTYTKLREIEARADAGQSQNIILNNLNTLVSGIDFQVGKPNRTESAMNRYDSCEVELRASEQLKLVLGEEPPPDDILFKFPTEGDSDDQQGS